MGVAEVVVAVSTNHREQVVPGRRVPTPQRVEVGEVPSGKAKSAGRDGVEIKFCFCLFFGFFCFVFFFS